MEASNSGWLEVPVLIHGITPQAKVEDHTPLYRDFIARVNRALVQRGKPAFSSDPISVEWGWEASKAPDRYLAAAERELADKVLPEVRRNFDFAPVFFGLRPAYKKLRETFFYGFDDLFYYVSEDGEATIRKKLFNEISREIRLRRVEARRVTHNISLTFFAHSAGSVIVHDLLFHLFGRKGGSPAGKQVNKLRALAARGSARVRRFYTIGSPIAPLAVRSNAVIQKILNGVKFMPGEIGLAPAAGLENPRWVNFWDKDDIFAYPVEFLYDVGGGEGRVVIEDKYVDLGPFLGDLFPYCHHKYWTSRRVINYIAETY